ncbi:MAG: di-trans,poly-cis-decaprenylcistransferase [Candidatus Acidiferrales bacterium]
MALHFAKRSTLTLHLDSSLHVAILMDGNGRWAAGRGLSRSEGHRAGVEAVRRVVKAAPSLGVGILTLFAFSGDNWQRPGSEVSALLALVEEYLRDESETCARNGVRVRVIGRRDRIPPSLMAAIQFAERVTSASRSLELRIAVDYSGREAILRAACWMLSSLEISQNEFARKLGEVTHAGAASADVDLLIRTGGEHRLSDFLLWECAYAELVFTPKMWPDFAKEDLESALRDFASRERRFGRLPAAMAGD